MRSLPSYRPEPPEGRRSGDIFPARRRVRGAVPERFLHSLRSVEMTVRDRMAQNGRPAAAYPGYRPGPRSSECDSKTATILSDSAERASHFVSPLLPSTVFHMTEPSAATPNSVS